MTHPVSTHVWSLTDYAAAWRWQQATATSVRNGGAEAFALLQHPPVYTFGRRVRPEHLLESREELRERGAGVVETNRGGDVTFHGPGQLVGYPILDLHRRGLGPAEYVRMLESMLLRVLDRFGIDAWRSPGRPGVWIDRGKVAAIGVRIERGVSLHGFALNVDPDLRWFDAIVPCGLPDTAVTSMAKALGCTPDMAAVANVVAQEFSSVFSTSVDAGALAVNCCNRLIRTAAVKEH